MTDVFDISDEVLKAYQAKEPVYNPAKTNLSLARDMDEKLEAKSLLLARSAGMPFNFVRADPDFAQRMSQLPDFDFLMDQAPATNEYYAKSLTNAAISKLDHEKLVEIEKIASQEKPELTIGRLAGSFWNQLRHSFSQKASAQVARTKQYDPLNKADRLRFWAELNEQEQIAFEKLVAGYMKEGKTADLAQQSAIQTWLKETSDLWQNLADLPAFELPEEYKKSSGFFEDVAGGLGGSIVDTAVTAFNPIAGVKSIFETMYGAKYEQLIESGMDPKLAEKAAWTSAAGKTPLEFAGNLIKISAFTKMLKPGKAKDFIIAALQASLGEGFEEYLQNFPDELANMIAANPDMSETEILTEFFSRLPEIAVSPEGWYQAGVGAFSGLFLTGVGKSVGTSIDLAKYTLNKHETQTFIDKHDQINQAVEESQTKELAAEKSKEHLDLLGINEPAYLTSEGLLTLYQEDSVDTNRMLQQIGIETEKAVSDAQQGIDTKLDMAGIHAFWTPEEYGKIKRDIKPAPSAMSLNELDQVDVLKEVGTIAELQKEIEGKETNIRKELERIRREVVKVGYTKQYAESYTKGILDPVSKRWESEGLDRLEFLKKIKIQRKPFGQRVKQKAKQFFQGEKAQTKTKEFKRWFGGSKVTDNEGKPLVVYHGTPGSVFNEFRIEKSGTGPITGHPIAKYGFFFSPDKDYTNTYSGKTGSVISAYLSIKKPYKLDMFGKESQTMANEKGIAIDEKVKPFIEGLKNKGYDGIKIYMGDELKEYMVFDPTQIKSVYNQGSFDPDNPNILFQPNRGSIEFTDQKTLISLFENADLSTLIHETGHLFFNEMQSIINSGAASNTLQTDYNTFLNWLNAKPGQELTKDQQEQFARGFEAYMLEGKTPTQELTSVFERFKNWLLKVYQSIRDLNISLTDEVREAFGRMFTIKQEIFNTATENDITQMSKAEMDALGVVEDDRVYLNKLIDQVYEKAEIAMHKYRNRDRRNLKKSWEEKAKKDIENDPLYILIDQLKENKLDSVEIKETFGEEAYQDLRKHGIVKSGGQSLSEAVLDTNFETEDDLAVALINAMTKQEAINSLVAIESLNHDNKYQASDFILDIPEYSEYLRVKSRYEMRADGKPVEATPRKAFKEYAQRTLDGYLVKDAIQHHRFMASMQKYSRIERSKYQQKKYGEASRANDKVRLNYEMASQAVKNRKEMEAILARVNRAIDRKIDNAYKQQLFRIIGRFGLSDRKFSIDRDVPTLAEFMTGLSKSASLDLLEVTPIFDSWITQEHKKGNYKDLKFSEFRQLNDVIQYLVKKGYEKQNQVLSDGRTRVEDTALNLIETILERKTRKKVFEEGTILRKLSDESRKRFAQHDALPFIVRRLDNFVSVKGVVGPNETFILRRINEAESNYLRKLKEVSDTLEPAINQLKSSFKRFPKNIETDVPVPEIMQRKGRRWGFEQVLAIALNRGNETNLNRIKEGYGLSDEDIYSLTSNLTKEDWEAVQTIWNTIDSLWPELDKVFFNQNGFHQKKVEALEFISPNGVKLKGGYYPIKYDSKLSRLVGGWNEKDDLLNATEAMFPTPSTKSGYMRERVEGSTMLPVDLSLNVLHSHIQDAIRYINFAETIRDIDRVTKWESREANVGYARAVEDVEGVPFYDMIRPALAYVARPHSGILTHTDKAAIKATSKATAYILGLKPSVALKQPFSIFGLINDVGPLNFIKGISSVIKNPIEAKKAMHELSPYMANRAKSIDRDIGEKIRSIKPEKNIKGISWKDVQDAMFGLIRGMDFITVYPAWQSAYLKRMNETGSIEEAVKYADDSIRMSQPSSQPVDLNQLQRSKVGWHRLFTMFSSFTMKFGQRQRYHFNAWRNGQLSGPEYFTRFAIENIAPPILMNLMFAGLQGREPEPEDILFDTFIYQFLGLFLASEFAFGIVSAQRGFRGSLFESAALTGLRIGVDFGANVIQWITDLGDEEKFQKALLSFADLLSFQVKVPASRIAKDVKKGIEQYESGQGTPFNILVPAAKQTRR